MKSDYHNVLPNISLREKRVWIRRQGIRTTLGKHRNGTTRFVQWRSFTGIFYKGMGDSTDLAYEDFFKKLYFDLYFICVVNDDD